jgi:hypothetical protein
MIAMIPPAFFMISTPHAPTGECERYARGPGSRHQHPTWILGFGPDDALPFELRKGEGVRKNQHSPTFKAKVVLEVLREEKTSAELAGQCQIHLS